MRREVIPRVMVPVILAPLEWYGQLTCLGAHLCMELNFTWGVKSPLLTDSIYFFLFSSRQSGNARRAVAMQPDRAARESLTDKNRDGAWCLDEWEGQRDRVLQDICARVAPPISSFQFLCRRGERGG